METSKNRITRDNNRYDGILRKTAYHEPLAITKMKIKDEKIWFEHKGCKGKHFILGNPHTFSGRMYAWCPIKERTFFVSKSEISNMSTECEYWIKGFLSGNQPDPPSNSDGDIDFDSISYKNWLKKIDEFERTGEWDLDTNE